MLLDNRGDFGGQLTNRCVLVTLKGEPMFKIRAGTRRPSRFGEPSEEVNSR